MRERRSRRENEQEIVNKGGGKGKGKKKDREIDEKGYWVDEMRGAERREEENKWKQEVNKAEEGEGWV